MSAVAGYFAAKVSKIWNSEEPRMTVVVENLFDGSIVSRDHIHRVLHADPLLLETEIIWCSASRDHVFSARPVVRDFCTSCIPRSIHRCPNETGGAPSHTNNIPCQFPEQQFMPSPRFLCFLYGIVPFCTVYAKLFFIMSLLWQHQFYFLFGLFTVVVAIFEFTCAEMSITLTYF